MKRLTIISAFLFLFISGMSFSMLAQNAELQGTWVLTHIALENTEQMSVTPIDNVPEDISYSCPGKITFGEKNLCILYYGNDEGKTAFYLPNTEESFIYFSIQGTGTIPERQFQLSWNQENQSMQLKYNKMGKIPQQEQYIYDYQLQN